jgi:hypothetical protein
MGYYPGCRPDIERLRKLQSGWPNSGARFEPGTLQVRDRNTRFSNLTVGCSLEGNFSSCKAVVEYVKVKVPVTDPKVKRV